MKNPYPLDVWFEDYEGDGTVRHAVMVAFEGDCYKDRAICEVGVGVIREIKLGRLSVRPFDKDTMVGWKNINKRLKHKLEGRRQEAFRPIINKTRWSVWNGGLADHPDLRYEFKTMHEGIVQAQRILLARPDLEEVELTASYDKTNNSGFHGNWGGVWIVVMRDGRCLRYDNTRRCRSRRDPKGYLTGVHVTGYGKPKNSPHMPRRSWFGGKRQQIKFTASAKAPAEALE